MNIFVFKDRNNTEAVYIQITEEELQAYKENTTDKVYLMMVFKNVFNDWYARDCSKKIKAVFKAKGQSGKPLTTIPPYGYKKSEADKNVWEIDEEAAEEVRRIFQLCIDGYGPAQIARKLSEDNILTPTAYTELKKNGNITCSKP